MKHYGIAEWVDFSRGLKTAEDAAAMRSHAVGCEECREMADYCSQLAGVCSGMNEVEVPDHVIRLARSVFPVQMTATPKKILRLAAQAIYDSFLVPAPAGFRASWQVGWQALYRAGDCSLDVRIEPELRSCRAAVIGQISNHLIPDTRMSGLPVCVRSGKLIVAETKSNEFGEFQMEYEQQNRLHLCIYLDGGSKLIRVPLKRFAAEKPIATDRLKLGAGAKTRRSTKRPVQD